MLLFTEDICLSRELKIVHAHEFRSEICLEWLFKAQANLICRVDLVFREFQDICEESPKQGVCEGAWSLLQLSQHVPSKPQPYDKPFSGRLQAGLRVMLTSVSFDTGKGMHLQKIHGSTYVSICYPIIFTQELLIGIVHKQKIAGFSPSLDKRLAKAY